MASKFLAPGDKTGNKTRVLLMEEYQGINTNEDINITIFSNVFI